MDARMEKGSLKRRVAEHTYRLLSWGQNRVPPGLRSVLGFAFIVGGMFGFLPILGFWMLPLGVAFIALDVPPARRHIDAWMLKLYRQAYLDAPPAPTPPPSPTSNQ